MRSRFFPVADEIEKGLVNSRVVRELGMESRGHNSSLPDGDWMVAFSRNDFDFRADALDLWCADENHLQRRVLRGRSGRRGFSRPIFFHPVFFQLVLIRFTQKKLTFADGAVDLASVGVAANADVESAQAFLFGILYFGGQQDRSRAGTECGFHSDKLFQLFEPGLAQQIQEGSGFATGNDQAIDLVELLGLLDEHNFGSQLLEPAAVRVEIALQGQDSDGHVDLILP
jgi:hypothetical protein